MKKISKLFLLGLLLLNVACTESETIEIPTVKLLKKGTISLFQSHDVKFIENNEEAFSGEYHSCIDVYLVSPVTFEDLDSKQQSKDEIDLEGNSKLVVENKPLTAMESDCTAQNMPLENVFKARCSGFDGSIHFSFSKNDWVIDRVNQFIGIMDEKLGDVPCRVLED